MFEVPMRSHFVDMATAAHTAHTILAHNSLEHVNVDFGFAIIIVDDQFVLLASNQKT